MASSIETTIQAVITWVRHNHPKGVQGEAFVECLKEVSRRMSLQLACAAGPLMELCDIPLLPKTTPDKVQVILVSNFRVGTHRWRRACPIGNIKPSHGHNDAETISLTSMRRLCRLLPSVLIIVQLEAHCPTLNWPY